MEPTIVNVLSALGTILGVWAAAYTLYEHIRDARNREAAKSTARP